MIQLLKHNILHGLVLVALFANDLSAQKTFNATKPTNPTLTSTEKNEADKKEFELKDSSRFIGVFRLPIPKGNDFAELIPQATKPIDVSGFSFSTELQNYLLNRKNINFVGIEKHIHYAYITYSKISANRNGILNCSEIVTANLENVSKKNTNRVGMRAFATSSVLSPGSGEWYKIGVSSSGVYKIDYNFLKSMGINPDTVNPLQINIYGNSAGSLPEATGFAVTDDLLQNAIYISGEGDGVFNTSDYIVFYAKGPVNWTYNNSFKMFLHQQNYYSDTSYYFLNISSVSIPKRVTTTVNSSIPNTTVTGFDDYFVHETNSHNFIKSGRTWVGEEFDILDYRNFPFGFSGLKTDERIKFYGYFAGYTVGPSNISSFNVSIPEASISRTVNIAGIFPGSYSDAAKLVRDTFSFYTSVSSMNLDLTFTKFSSDSKGWLDYYIFNSRKYLSANTATILFRDKQTVGAGKIAQFDVASLNSNLKIWNVTSPSNAFNVGAVYSGSNWSFVQNTDSLLEFAAFNESTLPSPHFTNKIQPQNLHGLAQVPYLIVTHPLFLTQATELAAAHAANGMPNHVVTTEQIYNEFSSGMRDAAAIRNFVRMFYERAAGDPTQEPKYLLLFGDGSFDNKSVLGMGQNFIPTFQSTESIQITSSYTADDYFALLDNFELTASPTALLDIGVGRLIAKNSTEAQEMVDKIIGYMINAPSTESENCCGNSNTGNMGPWRNKIILLADDEDGSNYVYNCEDFNDLIDLYAPEMEVQKIYLDATTQTSTPGGQRYFEAESLLKNGVQNGALIVNYVGHGGEVGWAHERLLDIATINGWSNSPNLPIFVTATCEFSRFDDPFRTSAGELALLNPRGGCVSTLTTTRLVFSGANYNLNLAFYNNVFDLVSNEPKHLGEVIMLTKNTVLDPNTRNFCLLGDPALQLKLPYHRLELDSIGIQQNISGNDTIIYTPIASFTDTSKALSVVSMKGHVEDQAGTTLTGYNGVVYPKIYDKIKSLQTLGQDSDSPVVNFTEWKNLIFKGRSTVTNGNFTTTFVIPKDLNLTIGDGRFVGYTNDDTKDGHGYNQQFLVGGINLNAASDNTGPEINAYINDEKFVDGGTTNPNPFLIINLKDANGINTVGTGIGHDISCVLDNQTAKTIILNDKYEADKDSYQSGKVKYQFEELTPGEHTLKVKAFDVYNNSSESEIKFIVAEQNQIVLEHVLNYPNPFTTKTEFMFEHNFSCNFMMIQIQIFTITGKLVKTISENLSTTGFRVNGIFWDGKDDFGDKLARGTYIYRLKTKANSVTAEKIERLVILY